MTLLAPLGLLALLSLIILFIIYIIRPNYQQRVISSTYIWRLSLKYKKKRIPVSKLRNILLIICQVAIFVSCAFILAQPNEILLAKESGEEAIIILDSSASMYIETDGQTRFQRSVNDAIDLAEFTFSHGGKVSVIVADDEPEFIVGTRLDYLSAESLYRELRAMCDPTADNYNPYACSYGKSDIDKALTLCEDIITINENTQVFVYTDTNYLSVPDGVHVENLAYEEEWNVSILNARAEFTDNYYGYYVDVACYGRNFADCVVTLVVNSANDENIKVELNATLDLTDSQTYTIAFLHVLDGETMNDQSQTDIVVDMPTGVYSYDTARVFINQSGETYYDDNLYDDNEFYIYGGTKTPLSIQYCSSYSNPFVRGALLALREYYAADYEISITTHMYVAPGYGTTEGYDFYIFEHNCIPPSLPTDGVTMIFAPWYDIPASGITVSNPVALPTVGASLTREMDHPLIDGIMQEGISITQLYPVTYFDSTAYSVLLSCVGNPILLVADSDVLKVIYWAIDLHYSNFPLLTDFPRFFYNLFEYFFPPMVEKNAYEVGEEISLHSRGSDVIVENRILDYKNVLSVFPATVKLDLPGTYTVSQETFNWDTLSKPIYLTIPAAESNAHPESDTLYNPYEEAQSVTFYRDLLLYVAIALTALMFAEWLLQLRDNM